MRAQEIFDTVATHLFTQGEQATTIGRQCVYKTPSGLKCAVGCLIPDDMYSSKMEMKNVEKLIDAQFECGYTIPEYFNRCKSLLLKLQQVHDDEDYWDCTEVMKKRLAIIANKHKLDSSVLKTLSFKEPQY